MKQFKKVIIVDINTNVIIPWAGKEKKRDTTASDLKAFGKMMGIKKIESSASDAEEMMNQTTKETINNIGKIIVRNLTASQVFLLVPYKSVDKAKISRKSVYGSLAYKKDRARPKGYEYFDPSIKNVNKTCKALGLDAVVAIKCDYKRVVAYGNQAKFGKMYVTATMEMSVYDNKGSRLWSNTATRESSDKFKVTDGKYDTKKHDKAIISATENAGRYLFNDLKKKLRKIK